MEFITIKKLDTYQHYKERNMVWFKWYIDCLQNYDFSMLPDNVKWLFIGLICLACKCNNRIPFDKHYIASKISTEKNIDDAIDELLNKGLIVINEGEFAPIINNERDLEQIVFDQLNQNNNVLTKQYRLNNRYIDILVETEKNDIFVVEIKRTRLTEKSINQVLEYGALIETEKAKKPQLVLVGMYGFEQNFEIKRCNHEKISVYVYNKGKFNCYSDVKTPLFNTAIPIREEKKREEKKIYTVGHEAGQGDNLVIVPIQIPKAKNPEKAEILQKVYDFWNTKQIMHHKAITKAMATALGARLSEKNEEEDIIRTIDNYARIIGNSACFFKYKWGLAEFLKRGYYKFNDYGIALENYLKRDKFGKPLVPEATAKELTPAQVEAMKHKREAEIEKLRQRDYANLKGE